MPVIDIEKNPTALALTLTAEFAAPAEAVWQLWADPRKLERWWGPPTYPATMVEHDLAPGGRVTYFMTGPEGDRHHGWWQIVAVAAPASLEFVDGFADAAGVPNPDLPTTTARVTIASLAVGRTRMTMVSAFSSLEQLEQLVSMGMLEGLTAAVNQIDALLAA